SATATTTVALWAAPQLERGRLEAITGWLRRRDVALVAALTLLAVVLRAVMTRGLWVDEAISVAQAQLPLPEMLRELRAGDVHPPLHHLLLWGTTRLFGTSEVAVRLPSLLPGAALVPALFVLGRELYGRRTALVAAAAGAVAP